MQMRHHITMVYILIMASFLLSSCSGGGGGGGEGAAQESTNPSLTPTPTPTATPIVSDGDASLNVSSANFSDNQITVTGSGLSNVLSAKIQNGSSESTLTIGSQSASSLVLLIPSPLIMQMSLATKILISSATADTSVNLTLQVADDSITSTMLKENSVTNGKIVSLVWSKLTNTPTTLAGYGITDASSSTHTHAAADINSGTVSTSLIDTGTGANQIIKLDSNSRLPAVDGSQITNVRMPRSYLAGFRMANNSSDANNDIDINPGEARSFDNLSDLRMDNILTKRLDENWSEGSNHGMLDIGTKAADTWYHIYIIKNPTVGTVDVLASLEVNSLTNLPAGFTKYRRIGSIRTNSSSNILPFLQEGDEFRIANTQVYSNTAARAMSLLTISYVPLGVKVRPLLYASLIASTTNGSFQLNMSPGDSLTIGKVVVVAITYNLDNSITPIVAPYTNTLAQIGLEVIRTQPLANCYLYAYGWIDRRGQDD